MKTQRFRTRTWPRNRAPTRHRQLALLAALALAASGIPLPAAVIPLPAAVIDDMCGTEPKFVVGGGGLQNVSAEYSQACQLMFSGQFLDLSQDAFDGIKWPDSLPVGELNGRTLEVRLDLVGISDNDVFCHLGVDDGTDAGGYHLVIDPDEIGVLKYGGGSTLLFGELHEVVLSEDAPVTLVLALTGTQDGVLVRAKVLDRNSGTVLYASGPFLDGLGVDADVPGPPFDRLADWVPDGGAPVTSYAVAWAGVSQYAEGTPAPVEVVVDNLEYDLYDAPVLSSIERSVLLSWPAHIAEEQIVVAAETLEGPWVPCLEPIYKSRSHLCTTVPITHELQWLNPIEYFKLVPGQWFMDDFEGDLDDWSVIYGSPELEDHVSLATSDAGLHIRSSACPECETRFVNLVRGDGAMADFATSIDVVAWDRSTRPLVGLYGRIDPGVFSDPPVLRLYVGGVSTVLDTDPTQSLLWLEEVTGGGLSSAETAWISDPVSFPKMDPARNYRLVFTGVGNTLTLQLFDLAHPETAIATLQGKDEEQPFTEGLVGFCTFWWPTADITLDNFVAAGTQP